MLDTGNEVSVTDFEFTGGILFPDIISLNFTLSVDPAGERPVGAGASNTGIVVHPVCIQSQFHSWPADGSTYVGCGSMVAEPFISLSAGTCIFPVNRQSLKAVLSVPVKATPIRGLKIMCQYNNQWIDVFFAECFDEIPVTSECQVQASTQLDEDHAPYNAISTGNGTTSLNIKSIISKKWFTL